MIQYTLAVQSEDCLSMQFVNIKDNKKIDSIFRTGRLKFFPRYNKIIKKNALNTYSFHISLIQIKYLP